jgi:hypothetical protein
MAAVAARPGPRPGPCEFDEECTCQIYHAAAVGKRCAGCDHHASYHNPFKEEEQVNENGLFGCCKAVDKELSGDDCTYVSKPCKCKAFYLDDLSESCDGCLHHKSYHVPPIVKVSCKVALERNSFPGVNASPFTPLGTSSVPSYATGHTPLSQDAFASTPPFPPTESRPPEPPKATFTPTPSVQHQTAVPTTSHGAGLKDKGKSKVRDDGREAMNHHWVRNLTGMHSSSLVH